MSYTVEQFLHCDPLKLSPVVSGLSCLILSNFSILCLIKRCWFVSFGLFRSVIFVRFFVGCWLGEKEKRKEIKGKREIEGKRNWAEKEE